MKSPFPGMDPYIEASGLWPDFHDDLVGEIKRSLAAALPERYFVQTGERSYIVLAGVDEKESKEFIPDVGVFTPPGGTEKQAAVAEPKPEAGVTTMRAFIDHHARENFIEIYEAGPELRLVTSIEVLSPSNKRRGKGRKLYLRKRNALLLGAANFVEIDLLRGGKRMPMAEPWPSSPYYLLVAREQRAPYCRVHLAGYRDPLPEVPVPLAPPDADLPLALQPMIDAVYARNRYRKRFDYSKPLTPPLSTDDAAWLVKQIG
ncbi:MAG: DUF4058 family protein [Gemmataceae bacterium]